MYYEFLPYLTKGPLAIFFGSDQILTNLTDQSPGLHLPILLSLSVAFQATMLLCQKYQRVSHESVSQYIHNLKTTLVHNVSNVYGMIVLLVLNIGAIVFIHSHYLNIHKNKSDLLNQDIDDPNQTIFPKGLFVLALVIFISVLWPYHSHALR
jgi:hypothetical protein